MHPGRPAQRNGGAAMAEANHGAQASALPWWRFSLKQLLLATALVAVGCVALRNANTTWVAAMFGLAWMVLVASVLLVVFRDGERRSFWVGFAVLGWSYLLFPTLGFLGMGQQFDALITTRLSHSAYDWLYSEPVPLPPSASGFGPPMSSGMPMGSGGDDMYSGGMSGYGGSMGSDGSMMGGPGSGMPGMGGMYGGMPGGMCRTSRPRVHRPVATRLHERRTCPLDAAPGILRRLVRPVALCHTRQVRGCPAAETGGLVNPCRSPVRLTRSRRRRESAIQPQTNPAPPAAG